MKRYLTMTIISFLSVTFITLHAQPNNKNVRVSRKEISYTAGGKTFKGYIAYNAAKKGKRPGVLVVHEWWGCNDYVRMRARKLAALGYIAMAVDMYGDGKVANNPQEAQQLAEDVYGDMQVLKSRIQAAEEKLKTYSQTDTDNIAAIGYCFGGAFVLNAAKMGMNFKGVVSFHGSLAGVVPEKNLLKSKILVCHGGADKFESPEKIKKI